MKPAYVAVLDLRDAMDQKHAHTETVTLLNPTHLLIANELRCTHAEKRKVTHERTDQGSSPESPVMVANFRPGVLIVTRLKPQAYTLLFLTSILAIVPLAALLTQATESVAAKTGDSVGGLLNATLGNLTELVIALAALSAVSIPWLKHPLQARL